MAKTNHTETEKPSLLVQRLNNPAADGRIKSGCVNRPQPGVSMIPTLPCGLWCHAGFFFFFCLWMAMCSSPLISNRWRENLQMMVFHKDKQSKQRYSNTEKQLWGWSHDTKRLRRFNCCRLCCGRTALCVQRRPLGADVFRIISDFSSRWNLIVVFI